MSYKIAVVVYTDVDADQARVYRGLKTAKEFADAGDDVTIVFDGSGVESLAKLSRDDHQLHGLLQGLQGLVRGACAFCAGAHGVREAIDKAGWPLLTDYGGEASTRDLIVEGRTVLSF